MAKCDCYYQHGKKFLCYGTKEMEECSCGGDTSKCDFYPEKRKPKVQKRANEKRLIDADELCDSCMLLKGSRGCYSCNVYDADTVDAVEVVHGRWIDNIDENGYLCNAWRKCSACGGLNYSKRPPYCPNCGAKMDGERKDNE